MHLFIQNEKGGERERKERECSESTEMAKKKKKKKTIPSDISVEDGKG